MGVLACNRAGCESVMCDFYSSEFGYICWHCLQQLEGLSPKSYAEIHNFMSGCGRNCQEPTLDVYSIFKGRDNYEKV